KDKEILQGIKKHTNATLPPSTRLEHSLNLPVGLLVIPLFAFANAGISIDFSHFGEALLHSVSLGVIFGLIVGKAVGISLFSLVAIKLKVASMPSSASVAQLFGVSILAGIGFTMSMFISELAFASNPEFIFEAKASILVASIVAGSLGYIYLRVLSVLK
ncbi:MAG: Na+/H+ antiporter NhaA, partial [Sulfurimonas sp.]